MQDNNIWVELLMLLLSGSFGGLVGWFFTNLHYKKERSDNRSFAAQCIYQDLQSIESYFHDKTYGVNIRYLNQSWMELLAKCKVSKEISNHITKIYDGVYNYNQAHDRGEEPLMVKYRNDILQVTGYGNHARYINEIKCLAGKK